MIRPLRSNPSVTVGGLFDFDYDDYELAGPFFAGLVEAVQETKTGTVVSGGNIYKLRNKDDFQRTQKRMDLCKNIFAKYTPHIHELWSKGNSQLEKTFYLIHYGDWITWYLSELKNIDCSEVNVIDYLKGELSKA